jgi:hypothetical protein
MSSTGLHKIKQYTGKPTYMHPDKKTTGYFQRQVGQSIVESSLWFNTFQGTFLMGLTGFSPRSI